MRVTQSMLSSNMLRNLSSSYNKMGKLQEQLSSGKKVNRPSDDPVTVMKGMGYRMQVDKVEQYQKNLGEVHNWLDSSDDALDGVGQILNRITELTVDAANDTKTTEDRLKIVKEVEQLQLQMRDMGNTKVGDKYLFSGTKTGEALFGKNAAGDPTIGGSDITKPYPTAPVGSGFGKGVTVEVFDGVELKVNTDGFAIFSELDEMMSNLVNSIKGTAGSAPISSQLTEISSVQNTVLEARADIGARQNRADMMKNRLDAQEGSAKKQQSENEDIEYEEVITQMLTEESIHRAALSVGARIIQPSLVDFLR